MAVPDFQTLMLPILKLAGDGLQHTVAETVEHLAREFQLSDADQAELLQSGQSRFYNRVGWATTYLKKARLLQRTALGRFQITDRGREILASRPTSINVAFLESRFSEMKAFRKARSRSEVEEEPPFNTVDGSWKQRPGVEERVRMMMETSIPDAAVRIAAMHFLALAIDTADEELSSAWCVRETERGLRVITGRLLACEVGRSVMRVSVIGPVRDDVRGALGAEAENDEEFKFKMIPGGLLLTFPIERASEALSMLEDGMVSFIETAIGRVRTSVSLEDHVPEAVAYIASVVGRELPQPKIVPDSADAQGLDDSANDDDIGASKEPRVRGRPPIFEHGQRSIASLMSDIEREVIALPDLQRPFVWEDTKVRDLLNSLFVGFPVGTLVFWHTSNDKDARALGAERPGLRATTLVIDGQQRLTSLYAVTRGVEVVGKDGTERIITVAFRPRDGRFEVADAAIRNDPEFVSNITVLWNGTRLRTQIKRDLLNALRDKGRVVDDKYEDAVDYNLERAHSIVDYRFPTVDIRKTATAAVDEATEEDVAEIFVRINNQGTRLGQADFVLTLLSVYHGELRDRIEERSRAMSLGTVVAIDTQQLLRAVCGVAFGRARMSAVYRYLRGVDPSTGEADPEGRLKRLAQLDAAAKECMELTPWRDFLLRVQHAGFVNQALIASKNAIVNAYAFYMRGRKAAAPKGKLDEIISRWVFATLLTARYSGASETVFEQDLARITALTALQSNDADSFISALDGAMGEALTGDYWTFSLVSALETQKARAPAALAFRAAQIVLGARALFSDQLLRNLLDPPAHGTRAAIEAHHLFPAGWLFGRGIRDRRQVNQIANLADVGWHENIDIGSRAPVEYVARLREKLAIDDDRWGRSCAEHALPLGWESMDYEQFLRERRRRMADVIRVAYRQLGGKSHSAPIAPPWFLPGTEAVWRRIADVERALRLLVREVYVERFGENAPRRIEEALPDRDREVLTRALRARPPGSDPLSIADYLYLGQLPSLLFAKETWQQARLRLSGVEDAKLRVQSAIATIAPVRNEIAHVREIDNDRLLRATVACSDLLKMLEPRRNQ